MSSRRHRPSRQAGMSLVEMMIAMTVLAIGMAGSMVLFGLAIASNGRNKTDTGSTLVAQMVIEQIAAVPVRATTTTSQIVDCNPAGATTWTLQTTGGTGGTGASLKSNGEVNWSQDYTGVPDGYKMRYVGCGQGGQQIPYEVRWNVRQVNADNWTKLIVVSARQQFAGAWGASTNRMFAPPVTLRTIAGAP